MNFSDLNTLAKLSSVVQIAAIVLVLLGGALQASRFFIDKRINDIKDGRIHELQNRLSIISSLEIRIYLDEMTVNKPVSEKETSAGIQSVIALFAVDKTRYRFVTDFQFSSEQVTPEVRRAYFVYKPEDPSQILGKKVSLLGQIDKFVFNYSGFIEPLNFDKSNPNHRISLSVLMNGIEIVSIKEKPIPPKLLYSGEATLDVHEQFRNAELVYQKYAK
jgi:hypothetical protein